MPNSPNVLTSEDMWIADAFFRGGYGPCEEFASETSVLDAELSMPCEATNASTHQLASWGAVSDVWGTPVSELARCSPYPELPAGAIIASQPQIAPVLLTPEISVRLSENSSDPPTKLGNITAGVPDSSPVCTTSALPDATLAEYFDSWTSDSNSHIGDDDDFSSTEPSLKKPRFEYSLESPVPSVTCSKTPASLLQSLLLNESLDQPRAAQSDPPTELSAEARKPAFRGGLLAEEEAKRADRRRRNREASSRSYYNRKARVEKLEKTLKMEKEKATALYARDLELRRESNMLRQQLLNSFPGTRRL